jgi:hypothetical protein
MVTITPLAWQPPTTLLPPYNGNAGRQPGRTNKQ